MLIGVEWALSCLLSPLCWSLKSGTLTLLLSFQCLLLTQWKSSRAMSQHSSLSHYCFSSPKYGFVRQISSKNFTHPFYGSQINFGVNCFLGLKLVCSFARRVKACTCTTCLKHGTGFSTWLTFESFNMLRGEHSLLNYARLFCECLIFVWRSGKTSRYCCS